MYSRPFQNENMCCETLKYYYINIIMLTDISNEIS